MAKSGGGLQTTLVGYSSSSSDPSSSPARSRPAKSASSSLPRAQTTQAPQHLPAQALVSRQAPSPSPLAKKSSLPSPLRAQIVRPPTQHAGKDSASKTVQSPSVAAKNTAPPRKAYPAPEPAVLFVRPLSSNVKEAQLRQIFEDFGEVVNVEIPVDQQVNLPRSYGFVEFKNKADAKKALQYMDGGQIDGEVVKLKFAVAPHQMASSPKVAPHQMASSPTVAPPHASKGDAHNNKGAIGGENDSQKRHKEGASPPRKSPLDSRKQCPLN